MFDVTDPTTVVATGAAAVVTTIVIAVTVNFAVEIHPHWYRKISDTALQYHSLS